MAKELANMSEQFGALPMGTLIGAPLTAACDSQIQLAGATADFIQTVGFDNDKVRTARFNYTKLITKDDGSVEPKDMVLEVPLLSIVNIPSLAIRTVDITFDMEVKSSFEEKSSTDANVNTSVKGGLFTKVSIAGSVSTHKEQTRKSDNSAKYHVQVLARDDGMPEGLGRVLDILAAAIAEKPSEPPAKNPPGKTED